MFPATVDVAPGTLVLVLPIGSFEQHGPHLPLDTDTRIALAIIASALDLVDAHEFLVAPAVQISASDEHRAFAGTLSAGTEATADYIAGIVRSATWARGVCIVNGHGGNADALGIALRALEHGNVRHDIWYPVAGPDDDAHAGHTETSMMLAIDPSCVRSDLLEAGTAWTAGTSTEMTRRMRTAGVAGVSPNGVLGDPRTASARAGALMLEEHARSLAQRLTSCARRWPVRND